MPTLIGWSKSGSRFALAEEIEDTKPDLIADLSHTTGINTNVKVAVPFGINRYHKQGNIGLQFVHGGHSLQEMVIPVIQLEIKKNRKEMPPVEFEIIGGLNKITSGTLKVTLIQKMAVSNSYKSISVDFGVYSPENELVSNEETVVFDKTSDNPTDRIDNILITLTAKANNLTYGYLRAYESKDEKRINSVQGLNENVAISINNELDF